MFTPAPRVVLIPGLGMVTAAPDAQGADVSRQLYTRAIQVMKSASSLGRLRVIERRRELRG